MEDSEIAKNHKKYYKTLFVKEYNQCIKNNCQDFDIRLPYNNTKEYYEFLKTYSKTIDKNIKCEFIPMNKTHIYDPDDDDEYDCVRFS